MNNKELVKKLNEAFSQGKAEYVSAYIDKNITWNIIGMPIIHGKHDFMKMIQMMEMECAPELTIKNIIAEGDYVVVECSAKLNFKNENEDGNQFKLQKPSFCEIYLLRDGKVCELTTYIVDVSMSTDELKNI